MGVQTQPKLFVRAAAGWSHHAQAIGVQEQLHKHAIPKIQIILIFGNFEKDHLKKTFSQWSAPLPIRKHPELPNLLRNGY